MFRVAPALALASALLGQAPVRPLPPRDTTVEKTGTAVVRGRVTAADDGHPLARARVTLRVSDVRARLDPVYTDAEGNFEIRQLPAGHYSAAVAKAGYVLGRFGEANLIDRAVPFELVDRAVVAGLDFRMLKAGAISGRIVDDIGDPVVAASVEVNSLVRSNRDLSLVSEQDVVTDDLGEYRIGDLAPGTYVVRVLAGREAAILPGAPDEWRRSIGWPTTYVPGVASLGGAQRFTLGTGEEVTGVDLIVRPDQPTKLAVAATTSSGDFATGTLVLRGLDVNMAIPLHEGGTASVSLDPGTYIAWNPGQGAAPSGGMARVSIGPGDTSLNVRLAGAGRITGRILVEGGAPEAAGRVPLGIRSVGDLVPNAPIVKVSADGTFEASDLFGGVEFFLRGASANGAVKSVTYEGRNILDTVAEFNNGETLTGVNVVVTTHPSEISGVVVDASKRPAVGCSALLFPDDADALRSERLSRWARADLNGRFQAQALVPGVYFVAGVRSVDSVGWSTPEYLAALRARATRVVLGEGEKKNIAVECGEHP